MQTSLLGTDPASGIIHQERLQQVQTMLAQHPRAILSDNLALGIAAPFREGRLEVREAGDARPVLFAGCAQDAEDLEDLVNFRVAGEERLARGHFGEDAAHAPHVDAGAVLSAAEEDFRGAVPESDDLRVPLSVPTRDKKIRIEG